MTAPIDLRYTDPLTGSGALDGTNVGVTDAVWADVVGTGTRGGSATTFSGAVSGTAFAAADFGMADADVRVETFTGLGGGDALYFRVSDASNWWRVRQRHHRVTSGYYGPWYGTGWVYQSRTEFSAPGGAAVGTTYSSYVNGVPTVRTDTAPITAGGYPPMWFSRTTYTQSVTRDYYTSTSNYRYLIVEKSVAGVVSVVESWRVNSFGVLRVDCFGDRIQWYEPDGLTVHGWVDDSFNNDATLHGVGVGGSDSTTYSSLLHDFRLQLPGSLVPPSIESPVDGADVDISQPVKIRVVSNYGLDNPLTNVDIRWRVQGAASWNDVPNALSGPGEWTLPTAGMTAPLRIEMQARGTDSFSNQSGWGPASFFWLREVPTAPSFVSPDPGSTVVASLIAVVDFGQDATGRQARRVGEDPNNPGTIDEETIYQDNLTLTPTGTPGVYELSGDGAIHESGPEFIQARRQTADGGSAWSGWASLPVVMSLAAPYPPTVTWDSFLDPPQHDFLITPTPGDQTHPEGTELTIFRDGVPVFRTQAGLDPIAWTDKFAGPTHDYEFRLEADNGGAVIVK